MKHIIIVAVFAVVMSPGGALRAEDIVLVCGTGDSQEVLRTLGAAFEKTNPGTTVVVPTASGATAGSRPRRPASATSAVWRGR